MSNCWVMNATKTLHFFPPFCTIPAQTTLANYVSNQISLKALSLNLHADVKQTTAKSFRALDSLWDE